jgi:hypothetical protein
MGRGGEGRKKILFFFGVLVSILLAILSKPSAVVFPAVVILYEIARGKESLIAFLKRHWVFFVLTLMLSVLSFILLKVMLDAGESKPITGGLSSTTSSSLFMFFCTISNFLFLQ